MKIRVTSPSNDGIIKHLIQIYVWNNWHTWRKALQELVSVKEELHRELREIALLLKGRGDGKPAEMIEGLLAEHNELKADNVRLRIQLADARKDAAVVEKALKHNIKVLEQTSDDLLAQNCIQVCQKMVAQAKLKRAERANSQLSDTIVELLLEPAEPVYVYITRTFFSVPVHLENGILSIDIETIGL